MSTETKKNPLTVTHPPLDVERIKADFPILDQQINGHRLVYLDSAATSQKPRTVINALVEYYRKNNSNVHRGLHTLAERATEAYERTRSHLAMFLGDIPREELIFTRGTTESFNLLAYTWGEQELKAGDEILVSEMEHHANFVPWIMLAQRKKAIVRKLPITICGHLDLSDIDTLINEKTRMVAITQQSNVLGTYNPITEIAAKAKKVGALMVVDGAQAAPHMSVDLKSLGADVYAFSAHKMLGPTGVGVFWAKRKLLESMPPFLYGGEMIREVRYEKISFNELPNRFEAGTPNIADVIAFDTSLTYLEELGMARVAQHQQTLTAYALERLASIPGLEIQGPLDPTQRGGAISFTDPNIHPHDISTFLDSRGIAIRAGHHCAQPLMRTLGKVATARASFSIYNDEQDIDTLVSALHEMRSYFGVDANPLNR
jgi:cysteine desulfurase/selenocysteine lyase